MRPPGELLASGRDADIFEYGPGLVLRRSREGRSMSHEARIMQHVRAQGYPVPEVHEMSDDGLELVMQRIDGPDMVTAMGRRPWTLTRNGKVLADLHHRLHDLRAPDWMSPAPSGHGDRIVHLDLHPLNVLLTAKGPVVIDWPNAKRGNPSTDVALTWVLIAAGDIPEGNLMARMAGSARSLFVRSFLKRFDQAEIVKELAAAVEWKVKDAHMSDREIERMRQVVALAER